MISVMFEYFKDNGVTLPLPEITNVLGGVEVIVYNIHLNSLRETYAPI